MATAIRATKLYVPQSPVASVARPRLTRLLGDGASRKLTLVSAPAGFGKTTAVTEWIGRLRETSGTGVAWFSLDEFDSDPSRFLRYLIAALRTAIPGVGAEALSLLGSSPTPATESILTLLLNELATATDEVILVLDDYHVIDSEPVDAIVTFLLEQVPPRLHLVVTSREDPAFPLPRLRARGHLLEVRAADLRFTTEEAEEFLTEAMGLSLSGADAARLEARTEGWIAGLQLAALSLRGREDVGTFIDSFAGSHRFVLDYLVDEVLRRQPDQARDFLLRTSILDRLTGPLCDAVTLGTNGHETLVALERANLFVVSLDDHRRWYRYHHLFADVLRAFASSEVPELVPVLHLRASGWLEQHGSIADAVRHALAAPDTERAASLVEAHAQEMRRTRQGPLLLRWIEALPAATVERRPLLSVALAATLLDSGRLESVEQHLRAAERWLETAGSASSEPPGQLPVEPSSGAGVDPVAAQLPGLIAMHRAGLAMVSGDAAGAALHARRALEVASHDDRAARGGALGLVGLALWSGGELEQAHTSFAEGMALLREGGFLADSIGGVATLADIRAAQGRLAEALDAVTDALALSAGLGDADPRGALALHVSLGELLVERNDLVGAEHHLQLARDLGERTSWAHSRSRWCVASALVKMARGDVEAASDLVDQAGQLFTHDFFPDIRPVPAVRARTSLAGGRLREARAWLDAAGLRDELDPPLSYLREYEHVTAARVMVAEYRLEREVSRLADLRDLLERLLGAAEAGGRGRSVIEILVLMAMTEKAAGELGLALVALERALTLAGPQGHVRVFLDEGSAMEELVRRAEGQLGSRHTKRFAQELLEGFKEARGPQPADGASGSPLSALRRAEPGRTEPGWFEPLTERELEVLLLIAAGLSNRAIAQRLFRAESTIKGLNRVLFDKLQVDSRTEAIARARELGLL